MGATIETEEAGNLHRVGHQLRLCPARHGGGGGRDPLPRRGADPGRGRRRGPRHHPVPRRRRAPGEGVRPAGRHRRAGARPSGSRPPSTGTTWWWRARGGPLRPGPGRRPGRPPDGHGRRRGRRGLPGVGGRDRRHRVGDRGHQLSGLRRRPWPGSAAARSPDDRRRDRIRPLPDHRHRRTGRVRASPPCRGPWPPGWASTASTPGPCTGRWPGPPSTGRSTRATRRRWPAWPGPSSITVGERVTVDGTDVTEAIRGPEVSAAVSAVAANPDVRAVMVQRQREWAAERGGGVIEGRDIGSVVFPDADLKIYLTASADERARRRPEEGADAVARRDRIDSTRSVLAPGRGRGRPGHRHHRPARWRTSSRRW